jgi:hypothetical protein
MKTAEEIFNKIWDLDSELYTKGFPLKTKIKGREITVQINQVRVYHSDDEGVEVCFDEYALKPLCEDSKWLYKFSYDGDLLYGELDVKIPKDIDKRIKDLNKFLKGVGYESIDIYFRSVEYEKSKETNLKNYLQWLVRLGKEKEEKATEREFKINSQYTAVFNDKSDNVKVGCQTIPKKVIKELAAQL